MSRRHSSRFPKTQGKKKLQVSETVGAALFAKDPETAKAMASALINRKRLIELQLRPQDNAR